MHKKIVIILVFILFFSTSVPFTPGFQPSQRINDSTEIPYQEGWPQKTEGTILSPPVIADLNDDGTKEIIVGSGAFQGNRFNIYVFHSDGTVMDGWPIDLESDIFGSPAIGDIDNDDDLEIVITDVDKAYAWHHDGTPVNGWPITIGYCTSSPTLYDLDEDGDLEVIISCGERVNSYDRATVHIWHHDGSLFDGWPQIITDYDFSIIEYSSVAIGDIDADGDEEIVVGIRVVESGEAEYGYVYAWDESGEILNGFPVPIGKYGIVYASPSLGDLDDDGDLEIIVGAYNGKVMVLHHDGTPVDTWPKDVNSLIHELAIADIDQDGTLDIITGTVAYGYVYVWNEDGSSLPGWPKNIVGRILYSPVVGDIAGDGHLEVIVATNNGKIHAWFHDGKQVPGFPLTIGDESVSTPCLGDIDSDGDVELIAGSTDKYVYVWDLPMEYCEEGLEWPMFQHDLYHTGCYGFGKGFMVDANGPYYGRLGREIEFVGSQVNGEPPFSWQWEFGDGTGSTKRNPVHLYESVGEYTVNLTVVDNNGKVMFDCDQVEVSSFGRKEYGALNVKEIRGGIGLTVVIENNGIVDARDVEWCIEVDEWFNDEEGALLRPVDGMVSGVIDIPAGKTRQVWCPVLGDIKERWISIVVKSTFEIENCIAERSEDRHAILFFVL